MTLSVGADPAQGADDPAHGTHDRPASSAPGRARVRSGLLVAVLGAVCALQLRAVLGSGYSNDDVLNSQIPMEMGLRGWSTLDYWRDQTSFWQRTHGRFFPISGLETVLVFTTFTSRAGYKAFQVAIVVVALVAFVAFVRQLTGVLWAGLLGGLVAVAGMQVRDWNDPWLQYNGQQPTTLLLVLAAASAFLQHLRSGRWRWLVLALVPWTLVLMVYETSFALVVVFPVLAWGAAGSLRRRALSCALLLVPVLVLGAYVSSLRSDATEVTTSYTTSFDPAQVLPTFVEQVGAAVPLTYATFGPAPAPRPWHLGTLLPGPVDLLVVAGAAVVAVVALRGATPLPLRLRWQLVLLGGALWALPAGFVAITVRWQQELVKGLGYVSVYLQTFGMALIAVALVAAWRAWRPGRVPAWVPVAGAVLVSVALVVTQDGTRRAVDALQPLRWDREAFGHALDDGLLAGVQPGDGIVNQTAQTWATPAFVHAHGLPAVALDFNGPAGCNPVQAACLAGSRYRWSVSPEYGATAHTGQVLFAPIADVVDRTELDRPVLRTGELRAWVADPDVHADEPVPAVHALVRDVDTGGALHERAAAPDEVVVQDHGDGWLLLVVRPQGAPVDAGFLGFEVPGDPVPAG